MQSQVDRRHYDESQLVEIKLPLTYISYYNNSAAFERVDGQIEINGIPYQYVERRIYNDSLELLCIPNQMELKLRISGEDYCKVVNDIQHSQQGQHPGAAKTFMVDPYTVTDALQVGARPFITFSPAYYFSMWLPCPPGATDERPPAAACRA